MMRPMGWLAGFSLVFLGTLSSAEEDLPEIEVVLDEKLLDGETVTLEWTDFPTHFFSRPEEAEFGCARGLDGQECQLADALLSDSAEARVKAAEQLWSRHSRRHAAEVLKLALEEWAAEPAADSLRRKIEASLQPQAVLAELAQDDCEWGIWLAYLRPNALYVPALIEKLGNQDQQREAMLALGKSRDRRALKPLAAMLKGEDDVEAGFAADALALLDLPATESLLAEALTSEGWYRQARACWALSRIGTAASLPALRALSSDRRASQRLRRSAIEAMQKILEREQRLAMR